MMPFNIRMEHSKMFWEPVVYLVLPVVILAGLLFCAFEIWENMQFGIRDGREEHSGALRQRMKEKT